MIEPVYPGYFADPFVLKVGDAYYAYGTGAGREGDPRVFGVLRSNDLRRWEPLDNALVPLDDASKGSYWAPEVAERDGRFYMYYSAGGPEGESHKLRVATAERPEGPFVDAGRELLPDEPFSIDASPFRDPKDGRWYLFYAKDYFDGRAGTGLAVAPLADDMLSVAGASVEVLRAQWDWQIYERNRFWYDRTWDAWHCVEGPSVIFHEGRYYCLYSGGCWKTQDYGVGYGVAESVMGPYVDVADADGPVVLRAIPGKVIGPGHCSTVLGPDGETRHIVFHAWDAAHTARRMCVAPLAWGGGGPKARLVDR